MRANHVATLTALALAVAACGSAEDRTEAPAEPAADAGVSAAPTEPVQQAPVASGEAAGEPETAPDTADKNSVDDPAAQAPAADKTAAAPAKAPAAATPVAAVAKPAGPPAAYAVCRSCHAVEPGKHGIGPSLAGAFGQKAATRPGYAYSEALKNSGLVWTEANLDEWLKGSQKMVPGSKMFFPGMSNAEARHAVIEYMKTL